MEVQINFRVLPHNYEEYRNLLDNFLDDLERILDMTRESILVEEEDEID